MGSWREFGCNSASESGRMLVISLLILCKIKGLLCLQESRNVCGEASLEFKYLL